MRRVVAGMQAVRTSNAAETVEGVPVSVPAEWRGGAARDGGATRVFVIFAVVEPMKSTDGRSPPIAPKRGEHMPPGA